MIRRNGDGQGATSCQPLRHSAAGGGESPLAWHLRRSSSPTLVNEKENEMSESDTDSEWLFLVLCVCVLCICLFVCCSCLGPCCQDPLREHSSAPCVTKSLRNPPAYSSSLIKSETRQQQNFSALLLRAVFRIIFNFKIVKLTTPAPAPAPPSRPEGVRAASQAARVSSARGQSSACFP